ncbi:MAG TPA: hypothetical protein VKX29_04295 [Brumimicrobium sp.]|nr:hypothetical protein [Brumimicrobium sp.]
MKLLIIPILLITFLACSKYECVKSSAPDMIGEWIHKSENQGYHYIYIKKNGRGHMNGKNDHGNTQDTQARGWYIKEDVLYFSRFHNKAEEDKFTINTYPTVAAQQIATDFNTVEIGEVYMVLNNRVYKKNN